MVPLQQTADCSGIGGHPDSDPDFHLRHPLPPLNAAQWNMSQIPEHLAPPLLPAKLPLLRPKQGRVIAGVARGISMHLGVSVALVRIVFVLLACWFGVGALAMWRCGLPFPRGIPWPRLPGCAAPTAHAMHRLPGGTPPWVNPKARSSYRRRSTRHRMPGMPTPDWNSLQTLPLPRTPCAAHSRTPRNRPYSPESASCSSRCHPG